MGYIDPSQAEEANYLPFETLEESVLGERGKLLTETELFVAGLVIHASVSQPVKIAGIAIAALHDRGWQISDRMVKETIRSLRRTHGFPICSRKSKPAGYWWGRTEAELEEFVTSWQAQYLDEAMTLHRMLKTNYPRLAGQMKLALEE